MTTSLPWTVFRAAAGSSPEPCRMVTRGSEERSGDNLDWSRQKPRMLA